MTQKMSWLESHVGSMEEGIKLINDLQWNLTIGDNVVLAGDQVIFSTDNHESIEAFLYGMALAYSVIPENVLEQIKKVFLDE